MHLARKTIGLAAAVLVCACGSSFTQASPTGSVSVVANTSTLINDGTTAQVTATVTDSTGKPGVGTVSFVASSGSINGSSSTATATVDASGTAQVTYSCNIATDAPHCSAQLVVVTATWSGLSGGARIALQAPSTAIVAGTGTGTGAATGTGTVTAGSSATIVAGAVAPAVLGIKGSGIQESGLMSFTVTDGAGTPVAGATVTFAQAQPALVVLGHSSATTDAKGNASVDYTAGAQVGISAISATVASGASTSQAIAVRGARPSASGFSFRCDRTNLPVYTTTLEHETTTCIVRLSDRYGNRVGIATPVSFAAEAGQISATAMTKPFDFGNPTDPDEGSVSVTFSSDMGIGFSPRETTPIAGEPSNGALNPRDQLVTIVAMVRGEEAFVDANLNGAYDPGELFVDQGDPFIDSNDDDQYQGDAEPRFCAGPNCDTYHGPNGVWDSDRTIWVPTWVVFTEAGDVLADPWSPSSCLDYTDNNAGNSSSATQRVRVLDRWLNPPALGTTYAASLRSAQTGASLLTLGGFVEQDNLGAMDVNWTRVSAADPTLPCAVANTVDGACVMKTQFGAWDDGTRMALTVSNTNKTPAAAGAPAHACGVPSVGTQVASFNIDITVTGPHATVHANSIGSFGF